MAGYVQRIEASGLHGRFDMRLNLLPTVNVIWGRNGSGKTTLLHILANMLNGSFDRFAFLSFKAISLLFSNGAVLEVRRERPDEPDETIHVRCDGVEITAFRPADVRAHEAHGARPEEIVDEPEKTIGCVPTENLPASGAVYFPAFRTMIEAWSDELLRSRPSLYESLPPTYPRPRHFGEMMRSRRLTSLARRLFGAFVPELNYPSPLDIELALGDRIRAAAYQVAREGQVILSEAFLDAFAALVGSEQTEHEDAQSILEDIRRMLEELDQTHFIEEPASRQKDVYGRLRRITLSRQPDTLPEGAASVLSVYRRSLDRRLQLQRETFRPFERYVDSVNEFLEGKRMILTPPASTRDARVSSQVWIEFGDRSRVGLRALSSGERQIVSMLYAATYLCGQGSVVLIDEPEISLHVDWQRSLIAKMTAQLGDRQLIVCTHAPEIGADYEAHVQRIEPLSCSGSADSGSGTMVGDDRGPTE